MKKRTLFGIVFIVLLIVLVGCGKEEEVEDNSSAFIVNYYGEKTKVTAKEMIDTHNTNEVKFDKMYYRQNIEVKDKVKKVMKQGLVTCLYLDHDWVFATHDTSGKFVDFVSYLDAGEEIFVSGQVYDVGGYCGGDVIEVNITSDSVMKRE